MKKIGKYLLIVVLIIVFTFGYLKYFRTYTIMFDSQGGTWYQTQQVRINKTVENPGEPILIGYKFIGWYDGDVKYDFSSPVTKDITLVAKWEKVDENK